MNSLELGMYKHYKGGVYEVLGTALHSETLEPYVYYRHTSDDNNLSEFWIRPLSMFIENVEVNGQLVQRFIKIND